jgi:hypothetical protein
MFQFASLSYLCKNDFMRTTIEIPDDLFWKAKAQAALEGVRLRDVIERGLRLVLAESAPPVSRRVSFPLHRSQRPGVLAAEDVSRAEEQTQRDEDASRADAV